MPSKSLQHQYNNVSLKDLNSKEDAIRAIEESSGFIFPKIPIFLMRDRDVASIACQKEMSSYYLLPQNLKEDKEFCLKIISEQTNLDPGATVRLLLSPSGLPQSLKMDEDIIVALLSLSPGSYKLLPRMAFDSEAIIERILTEDLDLAEVFGYASSRLLGDLDFTVAMLKKDIGIYDSIPHSLKGNKRLLPIMYENSILQFSKEFLPDCDHLLGDNEIKEIDPDLASFIREVGLQEEFYKDEFQKTIDSYDDLMLYESSSDTIDDYRWTFAHTLSHMSSKDVSALFPIKWPEVQQYVDLQRTRNLIHTSKNEMKKSSRRQIKP